MLGPENTRVKLALHFQNFEDLRYLRNKEGDSLICSDCPLSVLAWPMDCQDKWTARATVQHGRRIGGSWIR